MIHTAVLTGDRALARVKGGGGGGGGGEAVLDARMSGREGKAVLDTSDVSIWKRRRFVNAFHGLEHQINNVSID